LPSRYARFGSLGESSTECVMRGDEHGYSLLGWGVVCASPTLCLHTVCLRIYEGYDGVER